jgi:nuclear cap-binding protein subunit 1
MLTCRRVPDMDLPLTHPKRAFMHRLIEMEIRLAYHDRIMESLPPAMQLTEDVYAPALQPTDPLFPYESKGKSCVRVPNKC